MQCLQQFFCFVYAGITTGLAQNSHKVLLLVKVLNVLSHQISHNKNGTLSLIEMSTLFIFSGERIHRSIISIKRSMENLTLPNVHILFSKSKKKRERLDLTGSQGLI